jgi:hypothetical protein
MIHATPKDINIIKNAPEPSIIIGYNGDDVESSTKFAFMLYESITNHFLYISSDFDYDSSEQAYQKAQEYINELKNLVNYQPVSEFLNLINFSDRILNFIGESYNTKQFTNEQITDMVNQRFKVKVPLEFYKNYKSEVNSVE